MKTIKTSNRVRKYTVLGVGLLLAAAVFPLGKNHETGDHHPKLEFRLFELMETVQNHGPEAGDLLAEERGIDLSDDGVRVIVSLSENMPETLLRDSLRELSRKIDALDGRVETTYGRRAQVVLPPSELAALASMAEVDSVRQPFRAIPLAISEGVASTGAASWQSLSGYRTSGDRVKVCVLDAGFEGYDALLGLELPVSVTTRSFRSDGDLTASPHGTACAEIVFDMAPDAELYLVNFSTDLEHHNAVDWIISQGVDVISYSVGWFNAGAGDGTGPICADVEKAAAAGIVWASAAGNSAQHHWQAKYRDVDDDKWCDFKNTGAERDYFAFYVEKGEAYDVLLNWDDWGSWNGTDYAGAEGQDYDLYLYNKDFEVIDLSANRQTNGYYPVESVSDVAKARGWRYIRIKKRAATRDCRLELFFLDGDQLEHVEAYGSLLIPSDSDSALAVGAVDWRNNAYHAYSSRGPTADSRIKPDICAPSGVSGVTYGQVNFYGTSASTPHVAGAVALLLSKTPYSVSQVQSILLGRALDLGSSGKDNSFGNGRLKLDR